MAELNIVWAEQYRPKTVDDCILPEATKKMIKDVIATGNIPSFIFAGSAGTGKTSLAYALAKDIDADVLYINASLDTSIDHIRDKVVSYSSSVSFEGNQKLVLLDEGEGMSQQAMNSLKGIYEQFPNVRFIITTNSLSKVIEPLKSRSVVVEFKADSKEKPKMASAMMKRIIAILKEKNVEYDPKVIAELVTKYFPDFRVTLNELQRYAASGKIDSGILIGAGKSDYRELIRAMADKNFKIVRTWVGENASTGSSSLFKDLYENCVDYFAPASIPTLIVTLSRYDFQGTHDVDQQINLAACLVELMVGCEMKNV